LNELFDNNQIVQNAF